MKPLEYIEKFKKDIERRKNLLPKISEIGINYLKTMEMDDNELRIHNSNERVLPNNPVYNSDVIEKKLKECIENRSLNGISPEEFESRYLQIFYGIGISTETEKRNWNTIFKSKLLRNTKNLLIKISNKYDLNSYDVETLIDMLENSKITVEEIDNLLAKGYNIKKIKDVLVNKEDSNI